MECSKRVMRYSRGANKLAGRTVLEEGRQRVGDSLAEQRPPSSSRRTLLLLNEERQPRAESHVILC